MIVTAEPHFMVQVPSRMVVMENIKPATTRDAEIETVPVQYIGNTSDYFRDTGVPTIAESDYRDIPNALLGARRQSGGAVTRAPNAMRRVNCAPRSPISRLPKTARRMAPNRSRNRRKGAHGHQQRGEDEEIAILVVRAGAREEVQRRDEAVRSQKKAPPMRIRRFRG